MFIPAFCILIPVQCVAGDMVLGYGLANTNVNNSDYDAYIGKGVQMPDVVLVKKSYHEKRKRRQERGAHRGWRLKQLNMEVDQSEDNVDRELFLQVCS